MNNYDNNICRLCFVVSAEQMQDLKQNQEMHKLLACFSIKLIMNDIFPHSVCKDCVDKVNELYEFQLKIKKNEEKLLLYVRNEEPLKNIYKLKSDVAMKAEKSISNLSEDIKLKDDIDETFPNEFCSDDELTLSSLKKEQDVSVVNEKKEHLNPESKPEKKVTSNSNKEFKCLTCFSLFESKKELITHYSSKHGEEKKTEEYTIETTDGVTLYKCKDCNKVFEKKKKIVHHVIIHQKQRPFVCNMCGRTYKTPGEIMRHARAHDGDRLLCPQNCGYSTVYRGAMKVHVRGHSENPHFKYTCEKCGKGFNVKTWHDQHQNLHTGLKPFVCAICGLAFHMDKYLTSHRSTVHPQSSDVRRYVCVHCQLPCDSRRSLTLHMEVHGIKKRFLCDTCGKVLSSAEKLKYHKESNHLGMKPYTCSQCNKSFAKKYNLKLHARSHTGERAHSCATCGKTYVQRSTLLRHQRRFHTECKKCAKCEKSYADRNQLEMHEKVCLLT